MIEKWIEDLSLMAHGYCLMWDPKLLMLHATSDLIIALAYFAIPLGIYYYLKQRPDLQLKGLAWLFVAFIFLCGLTHLIALVTLWNPIYITQGTVKFMTAAVSILTAVALVQILPKALAIPSPEQLTKANLRLQNEADAHNKTAIELRKSKEHLEERVLLRTQELEAATQQFQTLFKEAPVAMLIVDANRRVIRGNGAAMTLFGCQFDARPRQLAQNYIPELTAQPTNGHDAEEADNSTSLRPTYLRARRADGSEFPAEIGMKAISINHKDHFIVSVFDLSERERKEQQVQLLMREVNHRSNNLLTVVQSIANQTARESSGEEFSDALIRRLRSLSASQDLIIRGDWQSVDLCDLIRKQLAHLGDALDAQCKISGPKLRLGPQAAQGIGMAIHELSTNSLKYGALSSDQGRVQITWDVSNSKDEPVYEISWKEIGGPQVSQPKRTGFGTIVVKRMAAAAVSGEVKMDYHPDGLSWRLSAPVQHSVVT